MRRCPIRLKHALRRIPGALASLIVFADPMKYYNITICCMPLFQGSRRAECRVYLDGSCFGGSFDRCLRRGGAAPVVVVVVVVRRRRGRAWLVGRVLKRRTVRRHRHAR